jgi:hypothetical protein
MIWHGFWLVLNLFGSNWSKQIVKTWRFQHEMDYKLSKFLKNHEKKNLVLKKIQCILFVNFSFDGGLLFNFYFDTIVVFITCIPNNYFMFQNSLW